MIVIYRFGIRSCLATSHKQIIKTPNARHRASWVSTQRCQRLFIHPLFIVRWRIAKYLGGKKQRAGNTTVPNWTSGSPHRKNGDLNFSESSEEEDHSVNRAAYLKPGNVLYVLT